ncbi:MAG TPA: sugar ABC transporter ATP-binding protein [Cellulomonas sp.]
MSVPVTAPAPGAPVAGAPVVEARDVVVTFGSFRALKGVDLAVRPGEIVGLLGENGAGKSTLIKVLAGVHRPSSGTVALGGEPVALTGPRDAIVRGVATVHQHSMLAANLTVAANLVLGDEPSRGPVVTEAAVRARARAICERVGIDLPLGSLVSDLGLAMRQRVEIVRAASQASAVMILDEPTAALDPPEVDELFETLRHLRAQGIAVLYISHRLDEIPRICDRVVVLRDGRQVGELTGDECVPDRIIPLLAGRPLDDLFPTLTEPRAEVVLRARQVATTGVAPVDLDLRAGEVIGLTGATGAGHRELARALAGIERRTGTVEVAGSTLTAGSVPAAIRAGVTYVSGDRAEGVFPDQPVWRNAAVGLWDRLTGPLGFVRSRAEHRAGLDLVERYGVRTADPGLPISALSGGNQQKVLIARWAGTGPRVVVLDEPTLGVDVGARREIYDLVAAQVAEGSAVVLVSADHPELRAMSHRVVVFADGRAVVELVAADATEEAVLAARIVAPETQEDHQ